MSKKEKPRVINAKGMTQKEINEYLDAGYSLANIYNPETLETRIFLEKDEKKMDNKDNGQKFGLLIGQVIMGCIALLVVAVTLWIILKLFTGM